MGTAEQTSSVTRPAYLRLATVADVPVLKRMIDGLAEVEKQTHANFATEDKLRDTLFRHPVFVGPTVYLLELASSTPSPSQDEAKASHEHEECLEVKLSAQIDDDETATYDSTAAPGARVVAGYILFFPNYSTFQAQPGLGLGDLFVRRQYRRQGLGTILLGAVARAAADRGFGRVDWPVVEWNANAIKFYEAMGAVVQQDLRLCRLTGDNLRSYKSK